MQTVVVLGCGPAGLLAAHAARLEGAKVSILSKKEKSVIGGAQYLHMAIPGLNEQDQPDGLIRIEKWGTAEGYAEKVYGDPKAETSWSQFEEGEVRAWDLRKTYDLLWDLHEEIIDDAMIYPEDIWHLLEEADMVVSSIPAHQLCMMRNGEHVFKKQKVLIKRAEAGLSMNNTIVWNGEPAFEWYRWSKIFGVKGGHEYPLGHVIRDATLVRKPLWTNCDCFPGVVRVGRYGMWMKGVLSHTAFLSVIGHLEGRHNAVL